MSILTGVLPTTAAAAQQAQAEALSGRTAANAAQQAVNTAIASGQAAVVQVGSSNPRRSASYGESRSVDTTFDSQRVKDNREESKDKEKKTTQPTVDVSA